MELPLLCILAFLAGFVDAIVGGGGLIQLPALFLFLPPEQSSSVALVLGAWGGSRLAILKGNRFVRALLLVVVSAMILRLAYELLWSS